MSSKGGNDRIVLSQLIDRFCQQDSTRTNPFTDNRVIIAELPDGKGDKHLGNFQKLLSEVFKINTKIACIVDNDYDLQSNDIVNESNENGTLLFRLRRKEIENYLIDPEIMARIAEDLATKRKEYTSGDTKYPSIEAIRNQLEIILASPEIRDAVKFQVTPKYRETLDHHLDPSSKEREVYK